MKVLMLSWEYKPQIVGGLGKHVVDLVPHLVAEGVEVHLVVPRFGEGARRESIPLPGGGTAKNGSKVYRIDVGEHHSDFYTNTWHDNVHIEGFCSHLIHRIGGFDLIHNHDWLSAFAAIGVKTNFHIPLLATIHATEMGRNHGHLWDEMQRQIHRTDWWLNYEAWRVITASRYMAGEVQSYFGAPPDKIDIIPNGVDPAPFDALNGADLSAFRAQYAQPYEPVVYYVGRIVPEKGLSVLVDAVPLVLQQWPGVKFVVAGGGGYVDELRAKAHAVGVADHIMFPGRIPDDVRDGLFKVADCAVFPSLYEPFGIVALEAMTAGTPVVVSDTGGLSEVVENHETGIKVSPGDPEALAWGILHTLQHPEWSRQRAMKANRMVRDEYNWPSIARKTVDVYERIADEARQGDWAYKP
jgi:glycogen synthase